MNHMKNISCSLFKKKRHINNCRSFGIFGNTSATSTAVIPNFVFVMGQMKSSATENQRLRRIQAANKQERKKTKRKVQLSVRIELLNNKYA